MTTLSWNPSTDNTGVVQYQVFHRTTQIATTANTSITIPTPPPMVTTYGVRAVDATGNISPFAPIHFGQLPDTTPPTAPSNFRVIAVCPTHVEIDWDPATDNTFLVGYEVHVDGRLITTVGDSKAFLPYPIYRGQPRRVDFLLRAKDSSAIFGPPLFRPGVVIWR